MMVIYLITLILFGFVHGQTTQTSSSSFSLGYDNAILDSISNITSTQFNKSRDVYCKRCVCKDGNNYECDFQQNCQSNNNCKMGLYCNCQFVCNYTKDFDHCGKFNTTNDNGKFDIKKYVSSGIIFYTYSEKKNKFVDELRFKKYFTEDAFDNVIKNQNDNNYYNIHHYKTHRILIPTGGFVALLMYIRRRCCLKTDIEHNKMTDDKEECV